MSPRPETSAASSLALGTTEMETFTPAFWYEPSHNAVHTGKKATFAELMISVTVGIDEPPPAGESPLLAPPDELQAATTVTTAARTAHKRPTEPYLAFLTLRSRTSAVSLADDK